MDILSFIKEYKESLIIITPFLSSLLGAFIGGFGVFFTVFRNSKTAQKQLLVQTISEERIKWINALHDEFVDFYKNLSIYEKILSESEEGSIDAEKTKKYELLVASIYKITLMLNPSEHYMNYLIERINLLLQVKSTLGDDHDLNPYLKTLREANDLQQIILKSEWRRVKEESAKGKELSNKKVNDLYNEIARSINVEVYEFVSEWVQMEKDSKKNERRRIL